MNFTVNKNVLLLLVLSTIFSFFIVTNELNAQIILESGPGPVSLEGCPTGFTRCDNGVRCVPTSCASLGCAPGTPNGCVNQDEVAITLCDDSILTCCGNCAELP